jgi:hypothetical protein
VLRFLDYRLQLTKELTAKAKAERDDLMRQLRERDDMLRDMTQDRMRDMRLDNRMETRSNWGPPPPPPP